MFETVKRVWRAARSLDKAFTADIKENDNKWRRLGQAHRDLPPMTFKEIQKQAFYQWQRYPLAARLIQIMVDFCSGQDLKVEVKIVKKGKDTEREDAQDVWDRFFEGRVNSVRSRLKKFLTDWFVNGELILPPFVNPTDGTVKLGFIDPLNVIKVKKDPMNALEPVTLIVSMPDSPGTEKEIQVIREDIDPLGKTYGKFIGEAFYFAINHVSNQSRGMSDLGNLLAWNDGFEAFLFGVLEGFDVRNLYFFDCMVEGKTEDELKTMAEKIQAPERGEVKLHNEKVTWETKVPDLKATDAAEAVKLIRRFIVGVGKGMPDHWFGEGADVNRATAEAMVVPTLRAIQIPAG